MAKRLVESTSETKISLLIINKRPVHLTIATLSLIKCEIENSRKKSINVVKSQCLKCWNKFIGNMRTSYANYGVVKKESLDPTKGQDILSWVKEVLKYGGLNEEAGRLPEKIEGGIQFIRCIKDGVILCKLLNVIEAGLIEGVHENTSTPFLLIDNVNRYLNVCQEKFGIAKTDNFMVADLHTDLNPKRVVDGLYLLTHCLHKAKDYRGPTLRK